MRYEHDHDDTALQGHIAAVTAQLCARANIALINEVVTVTWDNWSPGLRLTMPIGPVTLSALGVIEAKVGTDDITAIATVTHGQRPTLTISQAHNLTQQQLCEQLSLTYTAGFGPALADVPLSIQTAIAHQCQWSVDGLDHDPRIRPHSPLFAQILGTHARVGV